jgi:ribosome-associated translation inhibitor RaiA
MRVLVVGDRIRVRQDLRELVTRRLYFALGRFSPEIERVTARVGDVNGPRGGVDKRCRIVVKLKGLDCVTSDVHADDFEAAVAAATDRIGRSVARALERRRDRKRKPQVSMAGQRDSEHDGRSPAPTGRDGASISTRSDPEELKS